MILGGVAISASSVIDGPAGAMAGAMLLGAGVQGIEYNAENANSDGTVSGSWSWASYGENLGIGAATGFVSGGVGLAGEAVGGGILAAPPRAAASGAFNQFLTNAANGQALGTNLGAALGTRRRGRCVVRWRLQFRRRRVGGFHLELDRRSHRGDRE